MVSNLFFINISVRPSKVTTRMSWSRIIRPLKDIFKSLGTRKLKKNNLAPDLLNRLFILAVLILSALISSLAIILAISGFFKTLYYSLL